MESYVVTVPVNVHYFTLNNSNYNKKLTLVAAHEAGLATLQVACEGFVISNSVMFEYKLPPHEEGGATVTSDTKTEQRSSDNLLRFTLLQRLEAMDDRLQIKQEPEGNDLVSFTLLLKFLRRKQFLR